MITIYYIIYKVIIYYMVTNITINKIKKNIFFTPPTPKDCDGQQLIINLF